MSQGVNPSSGGKQPVSRPTESTVPQEGVKDKGNVSENDVQKLESILDGDETVKKETGETGTKPTKGLPTGKFGKLEGKKEDASKLGKAKGELAAQGSVANVGQAIIDSLGQALAPGKTGATGPSTSAQEVAQLASDMVDKMLVSDPNLSAGKEVRLTLGKEAGRDLVGVNVLINTKETPGGKELNITFVTNRAESANLVHQNLEALNTQLKNELTSFPNISVDVQEQQTDTGGQDRQSKGEYISDESEDT